MFNAELRTQLRAEFSFLRPADFARVEVAGEGWGTTAYHLGPLTVRVPKSEAYAAALALEPRVVPALEAAGVPAVPHGMRGVPASDGRPLAAAHDYIDGTPARDAPRLKGRARDELARDLGAFIGALHAFPASEATRLGVPELDLWAQHYVRLIEATVPHLGPRTRAWIEARCAAFLGAGGSSEAPRVLVHGDLDGRNVLLTSDGALAGVIDFSDAMVADPALDLACLLNDWSWPFVERMTAHARLELDAGARERAAFYQAIGPLWDVRQGVATEDRAMLARGRAHLAARARAAARTR